MSSRLTLTDVILRFRFQPKHEEMIGGGVGEVETLITDNPFVQT